MNEPKDKLKIEAVRAEITVYKNALGHILIKVEDWDDDYNEFFETTESEFNSAAISLDKKRAILLVAKLNEFIEKME